MKIKCLLSLIILFESIMFVSCGLNMTDQEAYEFGRQLGTSIRSAIDN